MKKGLTVTVIIAFALAFALSNDSTLLAGPQFLSPYGAGPAPTIPILPPIN